MTGRFFKFLSIAALLAAAQWFAPARFTPIRSAVAAVSGVTCNMSITSINFGNAGAQSTNWLGFTGVTTNTTTTGYLTYYCTNSTSTPKTITACLSLGNPSGSTATRTMTGPGLLGFGKSLTYNLFQDPAGAVPWGSIYKPALGQSKNVSFTVPASGASAPTTVPIYAMIASGQTVYVGTFKDTYGAGDAVMDIASGNVATCPQAQDVKASFVVTTTVTNTCQVTTNPLVFPAKTSGDLNLSGATASTTLTVKCVDGHTGYQVGLDNGQNYSGGTRRMRGGPTFSNYISYGLYQDSNHMIAWGNDKGTNTVKGTTNPQTFTVYGSVPSGQAAPPFGNYFDVVTVFVYY